MLRSLLMAHTISAHRVRAKYRALADPSGVLGILQDPEFRPAIAAAATGLMSTLIPVLQCAWKKAKELYSDNLVETIDPNIFSDLETISEMQTEELSI